MLIRSLLMTVIVFAAQGGQPASDFALRFDHKGCHFEYLDTFKGTYSHVGATAPVPFVLSDEQRVRILNAVVAANFFELPVTTEADEGEQADTWELEVLNAGRRHSVTWRVGSKGHAPRALLDLQRTILDVILTHPALRLLPLRGDGCVGGPPKVR